MSSLRKLNIFIFILIVTCSTCASAIESDATGSGESLQLRLARQRKKTESEIAKKQKQQHNDEDVQATTRSQLARSPNYSTLNDLAEVQNSPTQMKQLNGPFGLVTANANVNNFPYQGHMPQVSLAFGPHGPMPYVDNTNKKFPTQEPFPGLMGFGIVPPGLVPPPFTQFSLTPVEESSLNNDAILSQQQPNLPHNFGNFMEQTTKTFSLPSYSNLHTSNFMNVGVLPQLTNAETVPQMPRMPPLPQLLTQVHRLQMGNFGAPPQFELNAPEALWPAFGRMQRSLEEKDEKEHLNAN